ncbi:MAG: SAM-dependent methyltransferase [Paraglaciecola sp.]|jgi:SAM-dependent methyltransferase
MDKTTLAVKNMYEKYPYPSGAPMMRTGTDVNLLLSYVNIYRENSESIHVLDAGCGRGVGLIAAAMLQPDVNFIGADINTTAVNDARLNAKNRGLTNIRFVEADLMTLEGIEVPPGGFDVIYSSGVLHHLSEPLTGLKNLEKVLAPHGVISLMVYGSYGRQALYRLIEGIDLMLPNENEIEERLPFARLLTQVANQTIFKGDYWENTSATDDIEFVDRCLNVNEVSYDINSLWQLIEEAKMKFIRWDDSEEWSINKLFDNKQLNDKLSQLNNKEQYKIIERIFERPKFELVISKETNFPRSTITVEAIEGLNFCVSPEVSFSVEKRNLNGFQRIETLSFKIKTKESQQIGNGLLAQAALMLVDQNTLFLGSEMTDALIEKGGTKIESIAVLVKLLSLNIIYCPH